MTKQQQKDEAYKLYEETIASARKLFDETIDPARKLFDETANPARKLYEAKIKEINEQDIEQDIIEVNGKRYQLIEEEV